MILAEMDFCYWCGKNLASAERVEQEGADNICTGEQTEGPDPFLAEVWDDPTPVDMCPGKRQDRRDDI